MSVLVSVLLALPGLPEEQAVVGALDRGSGGTRVVRRCVDLADLLAAASARTADLVVVSADLRRFDREAVARLQACGLVVVAVVGPSDEDAIHRVRRLGVDDVVSADLPVDRWADVVRTAAARGLAAVPDPAEEVALTTPVDAPAPDAAPPGRVLAVWGPVGAPGRTTMAVNLAAVAARSGLDTLLVDADTYGASVAAFLGLLDEASGLLAAVRAANTGQLDPPALARAARQAAPRLRVLSGLPRPQRWPELRPSALEVVLEVARRLVPLTVVDAGFCLEQDEEIVYDTAAPRRNGATLAALQAADVVVALGSADPVGLQRLLRGLPEARTHVGGDLHVVVNRTRRGHRRGFGQQPVVDLIARHTGLVPALCLPEDREACDLAMASGRSLVEAAPRSALVAALEHLAAQVVPARAA